MTKKAQNAGNIIISLLVVFIGLVIFIAGFPAWKLVINDFTSSSTNLAVNLIVKFMPFFGFGMFIILFYSIFNRGGGGQ